MVATCKWFFFSFFGENMPKVTLGKKKKTRLSLHWKSEEDIGDLYVKNVKTLN
jgi:hypothetical protein